LPDAPAEMAGTIDATIFSSDTKNLGADREARIDSGEDLNRL